MFLTRIGHRLAINSTFCRISVGGVGITGRRSSSSSIHLRRQISSSTFIAASHNTKHALPKKNEEQRIKLHIGFASLSNTLPFTAAESSDNKQLVGDTELDTQTIIMLTSLRGGITNFDTPAPPTIDSNNKTLHSGVNSTTCWNANRTSEKQLLKSFNQAWDVLVEEDDDEANHVVSEKSIITLSCRLGYRSAVVLSNDVLKDEMDNNNHSSLMEEEQSDWNEREGKFVGDARVGMLYAGKKQAVVDDEDDESTTTVSQPAVVLVHNLSQEYVLHSLRTSPLVQQYKLNKNDDDDKKKNHVEIISLAHNPETQMAAYLLSNHHDNNRANDKSTLVERARIYMKQCMTSAFVGYEIAVKDGLIDGYGVDSNGLSLPTSHDMYFDWRDVLECAVDAYLEVHGNDNDDVDGGGRSSLKVIRLPGNVLETRGLSVADEINSFFGTTCESTSGGGEGISSSSSSLSSEEGLPSFTEDESDSKVQQKRKLRKLRNLLPKSLDVNVTRPLTAYPYGGTGYGPRSNPGLAENSGGSSSTLGSTPPLFLNNGERGNDTATNNIGSSRDGRDIDATHPIRILDCQIEAAAADSGGGSSSDPTLIWTNDHYNRYGPRPAAYQPILNAALSHFDADEILEASRERELTVEERETLDGCKLLRDLIHDLDVSLDTMKSFASYEEYLLKVAVPLMYGTFEELDEESSTMLQLFFKVHGMAVRMVVARWTRDLILGGWKKVDNSTTGANDDEDDANLKKDKDQEKAIGEIWQSYGFGDFNGGYNVPEDVTLQEFALKHLLQKDAVKGVVVGCSRPEHVLEALRAADTSGSEENEKD